MTLTLCQKTTSIKCTTQNSTVFLCGEPFKWARWLRESERAQWLTFRELNKESTN